MGPGLWESLGRPVRILNGWPHATVGVRPLPLGHRHRTEEVTGSPAEFKVGVCEGAVSPETRVATAGTSGRSLRPSEWPVLPRPSQVNFWHSDQCNMINGTSGQMWAPFMTPQSSLEFYSPEACR